MSIWWQTLGWPHVLMRVEAETDPRHVPGVRTTFDRNQIREPSDGLISLPLCVALNPNIVSRDQDVMLSLPSATTRQETDRHRHPIHYDIWSGSISMMFGCAFIVLFNIATQLTNVVMRRSRRHNKFGNKVDERYPSCSMKLQGDERRRWGRHA